MHHHMWFLMLKTYLLNRVRKKLTETAAADVVTKMILPLMDYADIIYSAAGKTKLAELQVHINKCLRTCNRKPPHLSRLKLHKKYKVLPLRLRREMHTIKFAFKRSLDPKYSDDRGIVTRAHDNRMLKTFFTRRATVQRSVEYKCAQYWNALDHDLRECKEYGIFSDRLGRRYREKLTALQEM